MPELPPWTTARRQQIGNHVRQHREWANLSQGDLVNRTGLDRRTVQRIERGTTDARLSWLLVIADAIGISLNELIEPRTAG